MSWIFSRALMDAYENSRSSQGQAAESSAVNCSVGKPSAQLSVMPTPHPFWRNDKPMESWGHSRFGLTCAVLTEDRGEELLTWFRAGFRAKTSVQPEGGPESPGPAADSGKSFRESLAKFDPLTSSWKTHQCLLLGDLEPFSGTWPRWGMMLGGVCWEQSMPVRLTKEKESGSLDGTWATPAASDAQRGGTITPGMSGRSLAQQIKTPHMWPTPCLPGNGGTNGKAKLKKMLIPTPTVHGNHNRKGISKSSGDGLATWVKWATPQARDYRTGQTDRWENPERTRNLNDQIGGQLNPQFVEWLMGWVLNWTSTEPLPPDTWAAWQKRFQAGPTGFEESATGKCPPSSVSHGKPSTPEADK